LGLGGWSVAEYADDEPFGPDFDLVPIGQRLHATHTRAVDEGTVLAAQVLDRRSRRGDDDARSRRET
jgi:hypothetical protein